MTITALELRERLQYDPNTGRWVWLKTSRAGFVGKPAGSLDAKGYWVIKINGQSYKASRLAYLYMTGEWPEDEMDHINRTSWDDCWTNLRPATRTENNLNRDYTGVTGHKCIYYREQYNRWIVQIENIYVGSYVTLDKAITARDTFIAERKAS
jgi:hypothetical protein